MTSEAICAKKTLKPARAVAPPSSDRAPPFTPLPPAQRRRNHRAPVHDSSSVSNGWKRLQLVPTRLKVKSKGTRNLKSLLGESIGVESGERGTENQVLLSQYQSTCLTR
ncbi:hypothetical protein ACS0TY_001578 [Phlomoides rotata]